MVTQSYFRVARILYETKTFFYCLTGNFRIFFFLEALFLDINGGSGFIHGGSGFIQYVPIFKNLLSFSQNLFYMDRVREGGEFGSTYKT